MSGRAEHFYNSVSFGRGQILFTVRYSRRRTLSITVSPDLSVTATAPIGAKIDDILTLVKKRAPWILRQQDFFRSFLPAAPPRRYVSGESHYYLGRQYRLKVIQSKEEKVKLIGRYIQVYAADRTDRARVQGMFRSWLLSHARARFERSLAECWERLHTNGIALPGMRIRKMATRWGSCSRRGFVYLHPDLIRAPSVCIEYVITHELCHLKYPDHGRGFYRLLSRVMPDWEPRKRRLEKMGALLL